MWDRGNITSLFSSNSEARLKHREGTALKQNEA